MIEERRACKGAPTISTYVGGAHAQECVACGTKVVDDMVDNRFFGFAAGCERGAVIATATHAGDLGESDFVALGPQGEVAR